MKNKIKENPILRNIKIASVFVLVFYISFRAEAQKNVFTVNFQLGVIDGEIGNAKVTLTKDGKLVKVMEARKGKFPVNLDFGAEYIFACTKNGYISKSILFDTHVPEGRENGEFADFDAVVGLKKQIVGEEITYSGPVGRVKFVASSDDFDFDTDFSTKAQEMQEKAEVVSKQKPASASVPVTANNTGTVKTVIESNSEPVKQKVAQTEQIVPQKPISKNKTETVIQEDRKKITTIIVNIDGSEYVYKKEEYNWGAIYFYKGTTNITEQTFDMETK